ncbi:hypothetical protein LTR15_012880 [Elasticomyces elasticus]|nr:hypothetical protein LTR15_012880 [Elasticomyces elasticus]
MAATAKVLNLPELLENILLSLPTRDLLFAQKRALFFRPGAASDVHSEFNKLVLDTGTHSSATVATNPLLLGIRTAFHTLKERPIVRPGPLKADSSSSCHRMFMTQPPVVLQIEFQSDVYVRLLERLGRVDLNGRRVPIEADQTFGDLAEFYSKFADRKGGKDVAAVSVVRSASG